SESCRALVAHDAGNAFCLLRGRTRDEKWHVAIQGLARSLYQALLALPPWTRSSAHADAVGCIALRRIHGWSTLAPSVSRLFTAQRRSGSRRSAVALVVVSAPARTPSIVTSVEPRGIPTDRGIPW